MASRIRSVTAAYHAPAKKNRAALAHNLIVVTDILDEFRRVPGLRVENWVK